VEQQFVGPAFTRVSTTCPFTIACTYTVTWKNAWLPAYVYGTVAVAPEPST
jgi:hypothetical protein